MRILIYVPQSRVIPAALDSIHQIDVAGHDVMLVFDRVGSNGPSHRYDIHCRKVNRGRDFAMSHAFGAVLFVDDDEIVPPDTLAKLLGTGADIAHGLHVWRNAPHQWSAALSLEWGNIVTVDQQPALAREHWGRPMETLGCTMHCTLIRRKALYHLPFHRDGPGACDWGLAFDARDKGFSQVTHLGVVCGHCEPATDDIFWPDIDAPGLWRADRLSEYEQETAYANGI